MIRPVELSRYVMTVCTLCLCLCSCMSGEDTKQADQADTEQNAAVSAKIYGGVWMMGEKELGHGSMAVSGQNLSAEVPVGALLTKLQSTLRAEEVPASQICLLPIVLTGYSDRTVYYSLYSDNAGAYQYIEVAGIGSKAGWRYVLKLHVKDSNVVQNNADSYCVSVWHVVQLAVYHDAEVMETDYQGEADLTFTSNRLIN